MKSVNNCEFNTSTTGTGSTIAVGSAVAGRQTPADAGVVNGQTVFVHITDTGDAWENSKATYSSTGPQLTGRTVLESSNSDAELNLSGSATVMITEFAGTLDARAAAFAWWGM